MPNATMKTFGFPETLVRQYDHWVLLVRPAQVTLGSLVLVSTSEKTAFGALPAEAFGELAAIVPALETALKSLVNYEKINYLMLMMVDPHVHFHVFPRYEGERTVAGITIADAGWPGPPDLKSAVKLDDGQIAALRAQLMTRIS
jgi:diadenosine tetraphosphate (Ap4A) HIT family hydrolase